MTEQRTPAEAPKRWNPLIDVEQPLMAKKLPPAEAARPDRPEPAKKA